MKLPTITNGNLLKVQSPGLTPEYDRPAAPGATKWEAAGDVDPERINYTNVIESKTRASRGDLGMPIEDIMIERTIVVDSNFPQGWAFEEGDVLTFQRDRVAQPEVETVQWLRTTDGLNLGGVIRLILRRA